MGGLGGSVDNDVVARVAGKMPERERGGSKTDGETQRRM